LSPGRNRSDLRQATVYEQLDAMTTLATSEARKAAVLSPCLPLRLASSPDYFN